MNQRANPDVLYVNGVPIPVSYFRAIDTAQFEVVDGDTGGTWLPLSLIVIGGAGLWIAGPSSLSSGSIVETPSASGLRVVLAANDVIGLGSGHSSATRVIHTPCGAYLDATATLVPPSTYNFSSEGTKLSGSGGRIFVPLRVHNGGTFEQVVFTMFLVSGHAGIPVSQPKMRVVAVLESGFVFPLKTTTGAEIGGWVQFAIATLGSYNGQIVTITYTCDAGILVDTTQFSYVAEIVDESGNNSLPGNVAIDLACTFTSIPDMRFS